MSEARIDTPLTLPCGVELPNRLAKAAMTEGLADACNRATARHAALYERWSRGGAGLLLTGNVQVDRRHLERPGNVAIEPDGDDESRRALERYARAGRVAGNHLWMQLSHAGRQTPASVNPTPGAPSAVKLTMPGNRFGEPRALSDGEIEDVIARFAHAAAVARETGFSGVQVHAAHGYLLSEFLSPDVNRRQDGWGGPLEGRARLVLEVVRAVRAEVGPDFPVSVKLNSADFQRGGFQHEESVEVARWLEREGVDLLELSGGTYEQPRMIRDDGLTLAPERSEAPRRSTVAREAYFLRYAEDLRKATRLPLMVTGGFRSRAAMDAALVSGACDVIGLARPLCVLPDGPARLLDGRLEVLPTPEHTLRLGPGRWLGPASPIDLLKAANGFGVQAWFCLQLLRLGDGLDPDLEMRVLPALIRYERGEARAAKALAQV